MTISCSDFTGAVWNQLIALNLVNNNAVEDEDLDTQTVMATEAITGLSDQVALLTNLLTELVGKLPANDTQAELPLDVALLGSLEPSLRYRIMNALGNDALRDAVHGPAARFLDEVLDAHESFTEIVDQYNDVTLADVLYLHSAIHKKNLIEVETPTSSRIVELVRQLPSATFWRQHIYVVDDAKAA